MPSDFTKLLIDGHRIGVEARLIDLCEMDDFAEMGRIRACMEVQRVLDESGLQITPPVDEGGLEDVRLISKKQEIGQFAKVFDEARELGECATVEFKASFYVKKDIDYQVVPREHHVSEALIHEVMKTICAFANASGGVLLIGVNDEGDVVGLDCEIPYLNQKKDFDGWRQFFLSCLEKNIINYRKLVPFLAWEIHSVAGKSVAVVIVKPKRSSLTICRSDKNKDTEEVYIRNGSSSLNLKLEEIEELIKSRYDN
jgi:schlafen family protein